MFALEQIAPIGVTPHGELLGKTFEYGWVGVGGGDYRGPGDGLEQRHVTARMQMAKAKKTYRKVLGH